ncbi:hydroxylase [Rhodococcus ruber Chol-4]|uniref:acyl-CoA dehydrogenase family protein n=1 Tax=Rhodococcus TaxID=1827 RepID=UPI000345A74B|nr:MULTISPECIES: acyl-CoA dehydrogenase family protein [Rhodococcus]MDX5452435.1 hydroxylase [Rhodococcus sp. (in: high G+C Gram-positive bacteria)]RIK09081.1 MAG: hydroxylase [Acidobacteriota bacterium]AWG97465.1 hydroxylase [Rhodococcus ruber]AXY50155.1 Pigment production hydroxylase [Rhodococcus ruber]KXF84939.1 hydroxylase [Rhodococcus ruber Chol-4]
MDITADQLMSRVNDLVPVLAERAQKTEENRAPLDETITDLIDSGILATLTPKAYGGLELGLDVAADIVRAISAVCPSTGWVTSFYIGAAWRVNIFTEQAQREVFADKPYTLTAGTAAPLRGVQKVEGGYRITGQTAWNSGSAHAEWFTFAGVSLEEGRPPAPLWFLVPRSEVEIHDTWYISGMAGTASNDVSVEDVFVPDYRTGPFDLALAGAAPGMLLHDNPMYHLPFLPFAMAEVTPVVVGAMRGATNAFIDRTRQRQGTLSQEKAAGKQAAQMRLGRALAAADAAETLLRAFFERLTAQRPEQSDPQDRAEMKLKAAYMTDLCRNALNDIVRGIGGDGFRTASPIQRFHRDLSVLAVHAFLDIDTASETMGRFTLDLPVADPLL